MLLTANDIADRVKLSTRHISERLTKQKDFPKCYRIGNSKRWDEKEFNDWLRRQKG